MRVLFITINTHRLTPAAEEQLRAIGATHILPARELPARFIRLCPCCSGGDGVMLDNTVIYRVEFSRPVSRREAGGVIGVVRVRANLKTAPKGKDLSAAELHLPATPKSQEVSSGGRANQPRITIDRMTPAQWAKAAEVLPGLPAQPEWKLSRLGRSDIISSACGELAASRWRANEKGFQGGMTLRLYFKSQEDRDVIVTQLEGFMRTIPVN